MDIIDHIKYKIMVIEMRNLKRTLKKDLEKIQPRKLNSFAGYMLYKKLLNTVPKYSMALDNKSITNADIGNSISFVTGEWDAYAVHYCEQWCFDKEHEYIVKVESRDLRRHFSFTGARARAIYEHAKQYCK